MSIFSKLVNYKILSTRKLMLRHSIFLFTLNFIFVFIVGLLPAKNLIPELYSLTVSLIFFSAVISISNRNIKYLYLAVILTISTWVSTYLDFSLIMHINSILAVMFFVYIIVVSVIRISRSKQVGSLEFLRAVNIYFLIGIAGGIIFRMLYKIDPSSINIVGNGILETTDLMYFSFETITTLGYGNITPHSPFAKTVAVFISMSGQLYLTMIIALLMGKYLKDSNVMQKNNKQEYKVNAKEYINPNREKL